MNKSNENMHLGVIASLKHGFEHFVHRELSFLEDNGATISVFPTKNAPGLYGPRETWKLFPWSYFSLVVSQVIGFFGQPRVYVTLLIEAIRFGALIDFVLAVAFSREMRNADLIYSTFGDHKLFIGYFCKRILGKPLVCTIHAYEIYENPNPALFAQAIAHCDRITTVTQYNREQLHNRFGLSPERIEVVRLSIDLEKYKPAKKFVVLVVGYFTQKKGHRVLLEAIKRINQPEFELWVVGTGRDSVDNVDVKGIARELGIESQVAFFGGLSGIALTAVYHACDVFCLPSHFDEFGGAEGFPTVIVEAMACGKPVVSTRHVEIPAIVEEILVEEKDVEGLAEALLKVYHSRTLREEMGVRNRELAVSHFSQANVRRTDAIMRDLCGKPSPKSQESSTDTTDAASELVAVE